MNITQHTHLTYCTNIHPGETWEDVFAQLKTNLLAVKESLVPHQPFGIGLRLSNQASIKCLEDISHFKHWLSENNCYVFTINGFPYGDFHHEVVKDNVHSPDWTSIERLKYTKRLADILAELLPDGIIGGISTSPLSYRWWHKNHEAVKEACTRNLLEAIKHLYRLKQEKGKKIHLDIEPEPDGLLETTQEFIDYYQNHIESKSVELAAKLLVDEKEALKIIRDHLQVCFDICHAAVEFEDIHASLSLLRECEIKIGKLQVSAALATDRFDKKTIDELSAFDEKSYLHQALYSLDGELTRYKDLGPALLSVHNQTQGELRTHFHVPIFEKDFGRLKSTQDSILQTFDFFKDSFFTEHIEVETYTWGVIPEQLKLDIVPSITRELTWVRKNLSIE